MPQACVFNILSQLHIIVHYATAYCLPLTFIPPAFAVLFPDFHFHRCFLLLSLPVQIPIPLANLVYILPKGIRQLSARTSVLALSCSTVPTFSKVGPTHSSGLVHLISKFILRQCKAEKLTLRLLPLKLCLLI